MSSDEILQELAVKIYEPSLSAVRDEAAFPDVSNLLHLSVLLIDGDTEIEMNGMLGFLENSTGRHLQRTVEVLRLIGAVSPAGVLSSVQDSMIRHGVTWERLRGGFEGGHEYQVTSFRKTHGAALDGFAGEISQIGRGFSLLSDGATYELLCKYLDSRLGDFQQEIDARKAQPKGPANGASRRG